MSKLARMRTLDECYAEIKQMDENTAISKYYIRQRAISGQIPVVMCGRKRLINLDGLIEYLSELFGEENMQEAKDYLRRLKRLV